MSIANSVVNLLVNIDADNRRAIAGLNQADKAAAVFAKSAGGNVDALRGRMDLLGTAIRIGAGAAIVKLGKASIDAYMRLDGLRRGLTAVMGSASAANAEMRRLQEVARLPGLGLEQAYEGSLRLQAAGMSADVARAALLGFGNALTTVGKGPAELDGVTLALTQIAAKGKVMAQEINQLAERVPQIRTIMKQAFGTADTEALAKMGVNSTEFISRIVSELSKLPRVTGGLKDDFDNMSDAIFQAQAAIGEGLAPGLGDIAKTVTSITNRFNSWSTELKSGLVQLTAYGSALLVVAVIVKKLKTDFSQLDIQKSMGAVQATTLLSGLRNDIALARADYTKASSARKSFGFNLVAEKEEALINGGGPYRYNLDNLKEYAKLAREEAAAKKNLTSATAALTAAQALNKKAQDSSLNVLELLTTGIKNAAKATWALIAANPKLLAIVAAGVALYGTYKAIGAYTDSLIPKVSKLSKQWEEEALAAARAKKALQDYLNVKIKLQPGGPTAKAASQAESDEARLKKLKALQKTDAQRIKDSETAKWAAVATGRGYISQEQLEKFTGKNSPEAIAQGIKARQKQIDDLNKKIKAENKSLANDAQKFQDSLTKPRDAWAKAATRAKKLGDEAGEFQAEAAVTYYNEMQEAYLKYGGKWISTRDEKARSAYADKAAAEAGKGKSGAARTKAMDAARAKATEEWEKKGLRKDKYNLAAEVQRIQNNWGFARDRAAWIAEQLTANTANAIGSANLDAFTAKAAQSGDEFGAELADATKARDSAIASAMERDLKTGSYKHKNENVRNALIASANAQFDLAQAEAVKTEQKKQLSQYIEATSLKYEDVATVARGKFDSYGEAIAQANATYVSEVGRAIDAKLDKNPNWQAMIDSAGKRRDASLRQALVDEYQKKSGEKLAESSAVRSAISLAAKSRAADLQDALDNEGKPKARLALLTQITDANIEAAKSQAMSDYLSKMNEYNVLKMKGVDIAERARLAELEYKQAVVEATREKKKSIDSEVESIRQRKLAMTGLTSLEGMWQRSMTAGVQEMFYNFPGSARERDSSGLITNKVPSTVGAGERLITQKEMAEIMKPLADELIAIRKALPATLINA